MITAKKKNDKYYPDLILGLEYEVKDIRDYLYLKHNKRHYCKKYFDFYRNGIKITMKQAISCLILESM